MSRSGVDCDEKIRRVYSYLVMDNLVEHNPIQDTVICEQKT